MLALNRKVHRAYNRVREGNFALDGFSGSTCTAKQSALSVPGKSAWLWRAFSADSVVRFGLRSFPNATCGPGRPYVPLNELFASDIITLALPTDPREQPSRVSRPRQMKNGVMLINTSRGALFDTVAVIEALKSGKVGYLGLDVYEEEDEIFFEDRSSLIH